MLFESVLKSYPISTTKTYFRDLVVSRHQTLKRPFKTRPPKQGRQKQLKVRGGGLGLSVALFHTKKASLNTF